MASQHRKLCLKWSDNTRGQFSTSLREQTRLKRADEDFQKAKVSSHYIPHEPVKAFVKTWGLIKGANIGIGRCSGAACLFVHRSVSQDLNLHLEEVDGWWSSNKWNTQGWLIDAVGWGEVWESLKGAEGKGWGIPWSPGRVLIRGRWQPVVCLGLSRETHTHGRSSFVSFCPPLPFISHRTLYEMIGNPWGSGLPVLKPHFV